MNETFSTYSTLSVLCCSYRCHLAKNLALAGRPREALAAIASKLVKREDLEPRVLRYLIDVSWTNATAAVTQPISNLSEEKRKELDNIRALQQQWKARKRGKAFSQSTGNREKENLRKKAEEALKVLQEMNVEVRKMSELEEIAKRSQFPTLFTSYDWILLTGWRSEASAPVSQAQGEIWVTPPPEDSEWLYTSFSSGWHGQV